MLRHSHSCFAARPAQRLRAPRSLCVRAATVIELPTQYSTVCASNAMCVQWESAAEVSRPRLQVACFQSCTLSGCCTATSGLLRRSSPRATLSSQKLQRQRRSPPAGSCCQTPHSRSPHQVACAATPLLDAEEPMQAPCTGAVRQPTVTAGAAALLQVT